MIYPKKNNIIFWFFRRYVKWQVEKNFRELVFDTIPVDQNKSVLLIANHYSFWDALILFCVNDLLFKKKFHVMILEETAKKEPFLKYAGAFSVQKNSRDMLLSLNYAASLLHDPGNLVLIFPQGKLYSNFTGHVHFESGIIKIINKAGGKFQLVFAAAFIQYLEHKKAGISVYLKSGPGEFSGKNLEELQNAYQQHYTLSKQQQTEISIKP